MSEALCELIWVAHIAEAKLLGRWSQPFAVEDRLPRAELADVMVPGGTVVRCGGQCFRAVVLEEAGHLNLYVLEIVCP